MLTKINVSHIITYMDKEILKQFTELRNGQKAITKRLDDSIKNSNKRFEKMDERFVKMDERFEKIDQKFEDLLLSVKDGFDNVCNRLDKVEDDVKIIKNTMVTKNYLHDKLADLGAEIGMRINAKEEKHKQFHTRIIEIIKRNKLAAPSELSELESMIA